MGKTRGQINQREGPGGKERGPVQTMEVQKSQINQQQCHLLDGITAKLCYVN